MGAQTDNISHAVGSWAARWRLLGLTSRRGYNLQLQPDVDQGSTFWFMDEVGAAAKAARGMAHEGASASPLQAEDPSGFAHATGGESPAAFETA